MGELVIRVRRILLVRHPETTANIEGCYVGRGDTPLTPRGIRQIALLSSAIHDFAPQVIWTSPLERAAIVAGRAATDTGLTARVDDRLTELDFGQAEGLTYAEAIEQGVTFDFASEHRPVAPGGESRRDILRRTSRAIDEILTEPEDRIAIVTHGGVLRSALVYLLELPISAIWAFQIDNGCVAQVELLDERGRLVEFRTVG